MFILVPCGCVMFSIVRKWLQYGSYGATLLCFFSFREYSKYYCGSINAVVTNFVLEQNMKNIKMRGKNMGSGPSEEGGWV